jgi:hypothetical protein
MARWCRNCAKSQPDEAELCSYCGVALPPEAHHPPGSTPPLSLHQYSNRSFNRQFDTHSIPLWGWLLIAVVIPLAAVAVTVALNGQLPGNIAQLPFTLWTNSNNTAVTAVVVKTPPVVQISITSRYPIPSVTPTPTATQRPTINTANPEQLRDMLHKSWIVFDWPAAINTLEALLKADPENSEYRAKLYAAHINYGQMLLNSGQSERAATEFLAASNIYPAGIEAKQWLAVLTPTAGTTPSITPQQ